MKKLLLMVLSSVLLLGFDLAAQQGGLMSNPNGLTLDTVSNTTGEGPWVKLSADAKVAGFELETTKISGTIAGKVYLRGANRLSSGVPVWADNPIDSITMLDRSQNVQFRAVDPAYNYYQLYWVGSGTMSASYRATYYYRKPK